MEPSTGHRSRNLAVVVVIILALAIAGGFYYYTQYYLQPDIQVTDLSVPTPSTNPQSSTVVNEGRVSSSGSFDYTPSLAGTYDLVYDNSFSVFSAKQVAVNYNVGGTPNSTSFTVLAGTSHTISVVVSPNERLDGSFQVSGGTDDDVNFEIVANTCTQHVSFTFTLVNAGTASGFANVSLTAGGQSFWSNRYYVPNGVSLPVSGQATIPDCLSRSFNVTINNVSKG